MAKKLKKAFTITELVIVIAVVAILAAVLIPTFSNVVRRANQSADTQNVKSMNETLSAAELLEERPTTMSEVISIVAESGYLIENLSPTGDGYDIVWDEEHNRLALLSDSGEAVYSDGDVTGSSWKLWKIAGEIPADAEEEGYSYYLTSGYAGGAVTVSAGFDAGENADVDVTLATTAAKDVTINTNGGDLTVNAPSASVDHYGSLQSVSITAVAGNSYHEYGTVAEQMTLVKGRVVLEGGADVKTLSLAPAADNASDIKVEMDANAKLTSVTAPDAGILNSENVDLSDTVEETVASGETQGLFAGGLGTEKNPYLIETAQQFVNIGQLSNEMVSVPYYFRLNADIDLKDRSVGIICNYFRGVLDGNGHSVTSPADKSGGAFATYGVGDVTFKDLTIVQRGGDNNESFTLLLYANFYLDEAYRGDVTFENISMIPESASTVVTQGTNSSFFVAQLSGNVSFIHCVNEVNMNFSQYAGIFIGGYVFTYGETRLTFIDCVNKATVSGSAVGFFTGNASQQPIKQIVEKADFSDDTTSASEAAAYIENCRNEGTIIYSLCYGAFAGGALTPKPDFNAGANDALQGKTDKYEPGTIINVGQTVGLVYEEENGNKQIKIEEKEMPDPNLNVTSYKFSFYASLSYKRPDGSSAGSSYLMITLPVIAAESAGSWSTQYVTSFVMEASNETYDALDAEVLTDDRTHNYKLHQNAEGEWEVVVDYQSVIDDESMLENGEGSASIAANATYQITAMNNVGQIVGSKVYTSADPIPVLG